MRFDSLLFPEKGDCVPMFWRGDAAHVGAQDAVLCVAGGAEVRFDTYYGLFPLAVYREYTVCRMPVLHVELQGSGGIHLIAADGNGRIVQQCCRAFSAGKRTELTLQLSEPQGDVLYWSLQAGTDCRLYAAYYAAQEQALCTPCLAVGICTYRREAFVSRNASQIAAAFRRLEGGHHLYIADNGRTLGKTLDALTDVTVLPNPNTGGSGGFTRVICAALEEPRFTHMLLMDDDIRFRPEVLGRTLHFLSLCREEYRYVTVGGAMCLLDEPWRQFEAGARLLPGGILEGLQMGHDLREAVQCIRNAAAPQQADYNSWWYCCMPMALMREKGLPMPFFIKMDDVEYALRLGTQTVCLPGVCVAHESFEKKYNPALDYYIIRNTLVTCALHDPDFSGKTAAKQLLGNVLRRVLLQRYDAAELVLWAYRDYLRGPAFLLKTDAAALNDCVMQHVPKPVPAPEGTQLTEQAAAGHAAAGLMLPCRRDHAVVHSLAARTADAYRTRTLTHYNPLSGLAYKTRLQRGRAAVLAARACAAAVRIWLGCGRAGRRYRIRSEALCDAGAWQLRNAPDSTE